MKNKKRTITIDVGLNNLPLCPFTDQEFGNCGLAAFIEAPLYAPSKCYRLHKPEGIYKALKSCPLRKVIFKVIGTT